MGCVLVPIVPPRQLLRLGEPRLGDACVEYDAVAALGDGIPEGLTAVLPPGAGGELEVDGKLQHCRGWIARGIPMGRAAEQRTAKLTVLRVLRLADAGTRPGGTPKEGP